MRSTLDAISKKFVASSSGSNHLKEILNLKRWHIEKTWKAPAWVKLAKRTCANKKEWGKTRRAKGVSVVDVAHGMWSYYGGLTCNERWIFKGKIAGCYLRPSVVIHLIFSCKFEICLNRLLRELWDPTRSLKTSIFEAFFRQIILSPLLVVN